jgi:hypothetical protein
MGRWVCLRCYESNDAALVSCAKCGLARGATPDAVEAGATSGFPVAQPTQAPNVLGGLVRRFGWLAVVAVIAGVGWYFSAGRGEGGEITRSGDLDITELRAGDCFDLQDRQEQVIEEVDAKVCSEPHQFEMMFVGNMPDGGFPADDVMTDYTLANCLPAFETYVGVPYEESRYDLFQFAPTEDGWNNGDHAMQCALFDTVDDELTMSLRGANR